MGVNWRENNSPISSYEGCSITGSPGSLSLWPGSWFKSVVLNHPNTSVPSNLPLTETDFVIYRSSEARNTEYIFVFRNYYDYGILVPSEGDMEDLRNALVS